MSYNNNRRKLRFLLCLLVTLIIYVGWVFYISEPTYIDNAQTYTNQLSDDGHKYPLYKYDFVVIPEHGLYATEDKNSVMTGMVLQIDGKHALVKIFEGGYSWEDYYDLILDKSHYRVIGSGTIYHKVNHYIGFNIMMISNAFIMILILIIGFTTIRSTISVLEENNLL